MDFPSAPSSLELSKDGSILTVTYGDTVSFWDAKTLQKVCEVKVPTTAASASLHPDKSIFVCGGDDLKVYKFDYLTGNEIGKFLFFLLSTIKLMICMLVILISYGKIILPVIFSSQLLNMC